MQQPPLILVFDSGFGGLTVLREVMRARPDADYIYIADSAAFPYGNLSEEQLLARVLNVFERLMGQYNPTIAVIACNTASTIVLPHLRGRYNIPFVGTVPAIKPAAQLSKSRLISVLATPGTVKNDYTKDLVEQFAEGCAVHLVGSKLLASIAEAKLKGEQISDQDILTEIRPCFVEAHGKRTDQIVLACTHYPLLLDEFHRLAPWEVNYVDPAPAIARRVTGLIGEQDETMPQSHKRSMLFTGAKPKGHDVIEMLAKFGIDAVYSLDIPLGPI
ncbi:MAG: glutamate racemase [Pseudomonadota bacterium]